MISPFSQCLQKRFAGHNKWSKIKHKKGAKDVSRAAVFSKCTKAIRAASRSCNGDLTNLHLQSAIAAAKAVQCPKDKIQDAINCVARGNAEEMVQIRYDGFLSTDCGRIPLILTALTDNKNRTAANVRTIMKKSNGELENTGANDWLFDYVGLAIVRKRRPDRIEGDHDESEENYDEKFQPIDENAEDDLLECALESGAFDVDFGDKMDPYAIIKCTTTDLHSLVLGLREGGYHVSEFEWRYVPKDPDSAIELRDDALIQWQRFLDKCDDDVDISNVYYNCNILE
jgi:transcriptional/translational regulatory protein YebC/TACO1